MENKLTVSLAKGQAHTCEKKLQLDSQAHASPSSLFFEFVGIGQIAQASLHRIEDFVLQTHDLCPAEIEGVYLEASASPLVQ